MTEISRQLTISFSSEKEKAQALRLSFSLRCQIFINFELKYPLLRIDYIYIFT